MIFKLEPEINGKQFINLSFDLFYSGEVNIPIIQPPCISATVDCVMPCRRYRFTDRYYENIPILEAKDY